MYKVFFNHKPIYLTTALAINSSETPLLHIKYTQQQSLIKALKSKQTQAVYLYHKDEQKLWKHFVKQFPEIEAAGGLVKHTDGRFLMIYRNGKWDLPKGKKEKKEILIDAAQREVIEETAVKDLIVKKPLPITYHIFSRNGRYRLKKTYWYLMATSYDGPLEPQYDEGIEQAVWKSPEEIPSMLENAYENIKIHFEQEGVMT
ncbi:MAG: NUDIX hydrolase [Flavobacteriaceae bacterium]